MNKEMRIIYFIAVIFAFFSLMADFFLNFNMSPTPLFISIIFMMLSIESLYWARKTKNPFTKTHYRIEFTLASSMSIWLVFIFFFQNIFILNITFSIIFLIMMMLLVYELVRYSNNLDNIAHYDKLSNYSNWIYELAKTQQELINIQRILVKEHTKKRR